MRAVYDGNYTVNYVEKQFRRVRGIFIKCYGQKVCESNSSAFDRRYNLRQEIRGISAKYSARDGGPVETGGKARHDNTSMR